MSEMDEFLKDWDELSFEYKNLEVSIETSSKIVKSGKKKYFAILTKFSSISECK